MWMRIVRKLHMYFIWGSMIRIALVGFIGLFFCILMHLTYNDHSSTGFNVFAYLLLVIFGLFTLFAFVLSFYDETRSEILTLSVLFGITRDRSFFQKSFFFWFLMRRCLFICIIVFVDRFPRI